jgi:hypothetical protein
LKTRNDRWRHDLGTRNAAIVNDVLRHELPRYGYTPDACRPID